MKKIFLSINILLYLFLSSCSLGSHSNTAIGDLFDKYRNKATFVMYDTNEDKMTIYNPKRASQEFIPASTFKIINALIGLETKTITNVDEVFYRYDNTPLDHKNWEQDISLKDGMKVSHVPAYQKLARLIGAQKMLAQLKVLRYGNQLIGKIDRFWLDGPTVISAIGQVNFLTQLAKLQLPYSKESQITVTNMIKLEESKNWVLFGKTGLINIDSSIDLGWFVGWVKKNKNLYVFATNIELSSKEDRSYRKDITIKILKNII